MQNKFIKIVKIDELLYQRWNNIIINYFGGTLDIFLNNELIVSKINITPILLANKIISGSKNGIHGGIKDVIFIKNTLTQSEIESIYKM